MATSPLGFTSGLWIFTWLLQVLPVFFYIGAYVHLTAWERAAAHAGHVSLYLLVFIVSVTGWMVATTFRVPMTKDVFGIDIPPIVTTVDRPVRQWIEESHMVLAYLLAAVVLIHVIGALRHHIFKRNEILRRMTWGMRA